MAFSRGFGTTCDELSGTHWTQRLSTGANVLRTTLTIMLGAPTREPSQECQGRGGWSGRLAALVHVLQNPRWARLRSGAFVACIIALCFLAWLPGNDLRRTPLGGHVEHVLSYFATTLAMGLALQRRVRLDVQCVLLTLYAAVLEVGQLYSPDRHASVRDFAFSTSGIAVGGLLLWGMRSLTRAAQTN